MLRKYLFLLCFSISVTNSRQFVNICERKVNAKLLDTASPGMEHTLSIGMVLKTLCTTVVLQCVIKEVLQNDETEHTSNSY